MSKRTVFISVITIISTFLVAFAVAWLLRPQSKQSHMQDLGVVRVTSPILNAVIRSPLTVTGEARGRWFFEASFPIKVLDQSGALLGTGVAQAQGEWMTENFVPFVAQVNFSYPNTKEGTLVFQKDNPSGDPARDQDVRMPIRFR